MVSSELLLHSAGCHWWICRTHEGRNYSWRDCQRGEELDCTVMHNNVVVTTRATNINQSGQYNFSCGGGPPLCFYVQVGVILSS